MGHLAKTEAQHKAQIEELMRDIMKMNELLRKEQR